MSYKRVIPRDLFNEAKFLKCIGKLSLAIHDNDCQLANHLTQVIEDESSGFQIDQHEGCGGLYSKNYFVFNKDATPVYLKSILNSKLNYPLLFEFKDEEEFVFDDDGKFSSEFLLSITGKGRPDKTVACRGCFENFLNPIKGQCCENCGVAL